MTFLTTHDAAMTMLYQGGSNAQLNRYNLWFHASAHNVANTDRSRKLVNRLSRLGMQVLVVPFDGPYDSYHVQQTVLRASQRGMLVVAELPAQVGISGMPVVERWLKAGAAGVDFGVVDGAQFPGALDAIREATTQFQAEYPGTFTSIMLRTNTVEEAAQLASLHQFDVLRFTAASAPPLDASNYGEEYARALSVFEAANALPAWDCSPDLVRLEANSLSPAAVAAAVAFQPGILHFHPGITDEVPQLRHALRLRESFGLAGATLLYNGRHASVGLIWLHTDRIELVLNFGDDDFLMDDDGRTILTSAPNEAGEGKLLVPPGELAWLRRPGV